MFTKVDVTSNVISITLIEWYVFSERLKYIPPGEPINCSTQIKYNLVFDSTIIILWSVNSTSQNSVILTFTSLTMTKTDGYITLETESCLRYGCTDSKNIYLDAIGYVVYNTLIE